MEQNKDKLQSGIPAKWGEVSLVPLPPGLSEALFSACVMLVLDWEERGDTAGELVIRMWRLLSVTDR